MRPSGKLLELNLFGKHLLVAMMFWTALCLFCSHRNGPTVSLGLCRRSKHFGQSHWSPRWLGVLGYRNFPVRGLRSQRLRWRFLWSLIFGRNSHEFMNHRPRFHAFPWILGDAFQVITDHFNFLVYGVDLAVRSIRQSALIIRWFVSSDMVLAQLTEKPCKKLSLSDPWQVVSVCFAACWLGFRLCLYATMLSCHASVHFGSVQSWFDPTKTGKCTWARHVSM